MNIWSVLLLILGATLLILRWNKGKTRIPILAILMSTLAFFIIVPRITQRLFSSSIESFADSDSAIYYDSWLELQNISAASIDPVNSFLFADWVAGWARGTSGQRQISVAWNRNYRCMWRVKGPLSTGPNLKKGQSVMSGDTIRLETVYDNVNLHSQPIRADYDDSFQFNEVTGFGFKELDDTNSHWVVTVDGGGAWKKSSKVSFTHANTGKFLTAPSKVKHNVFPDAAKKPCSLWLVGCAPKISSDAYWSVYRVEQPGARAVRFYKDIEMDEAVLIDYQLTGGKDVVLNTIRDGRPGHDFIKGIIVPENITVDIFRNSDKSNLLITYNAGRYDNLQIGACSCVVIRKFCPLIVYDQANYSGNMTCLPYGVSQIPNDAKSWVLSDSAQATFFSDSDEWVLTGAQKLVADKQTAKSTFGPVVIINAFPSASSKTLYRSQNDTASQTSFIVASQSTKLPTVSLAALQCYVNAAIIESTNGSRFWLDISGNNRHFVWDSLPRLVEGKLMSTDVNGQVARGPPSNSFGLGNGTQGFTFAIVCQPYSTSDSWGCSFVSNNGDPHGLSCHLPESVSWNLSFCFDQGWGSPSQKNSRLLVPSIAKLFDTNALNVLICRRNSNATDGRMSIWVNGSKISENTTASNELDLSSINSTLFTNFKGAAQAFAVYNTPLIDDDIKTLTTHFGKVYETNRQSLDAALYANVQTTMPGLSIRSGLTCFLDARNPRSAQSGNKIWKDISGRGNHFSWKSAPKLVNGKFVAISQNGSGLSGAPADAFGIEQNGGGYTILFAAKTNILSQNQAFRFPGEVGNQRGIFAHATWTDGTMYFDQAGCCDTNVQRVSTAIPWKSYNVYAVRRTPSNKTNANSSVNILQSNFNKMSIFINGVKAVEGSPAASTTKLSGKPVEIGASSTENYNWDADIGAFVVYKRALSDGELKVVADYLNSPKYGDSINVDGKADLSPNVKKGVCVAQTLQNASYSPTDCLSKSPNSDGSYSIVSSDGRGWCFTDNTDNTKWGWCKSNRSFDIDQAYDKSQSLSYTAARDYCSSKGGRLCNQDEICDVGIGGRPESGSIL